VTVDYLCSSPGTFAFIIFLWEFNLVLLGDSIPFIVPKGGNGVFSAADIGNFSGGGCIARAFFSKRFRMILVNDFKLFLYAYSSYSVRDNLCSQHTYYQEEEEKREEGKNPCSNNLLSIPYLGRSRSAKYHVRTSANPNSASKQPQF